MLSLEDIMQLFNFIGSLVCHQKPERTLRVGGHYLPVCARDTGVFVGLYLGYALLFFLRDKKARGPPNLYVTAVMTAPLLVDSFGQLLGFWTSTNDLRVITGLLFGTALAPFLVYALSFFHFKDKIPFLRKIQPENAVLDAEDQWLNEKALLLGIILSAILFFAIKLMLDSNFYPFYWIISTPIIFGIIWHFFILLPTLIVITAKHCTRRPKSKN
ncbi:MAG: DUF2085 domain-containing protein [Candidatus Bathyarchaeia archaeon]